uniref:Uncharacterized protein n=1 Tax=Aegilops tauschii subsp. strangulata TaxID=200361 RepID=A0A453G9Q1_AEGTS
NSTPRSSLFCWPAVSPSPAPPAWRSRNCSRACASHLSTITCAALS